MSEETLTKQKKAVDDVRLALKELESKINILIALGGNVSMKVHQVPFDVQPGEVCSIFINVEVQLSVTSKYLEEL